MAVTRAFLKGLGLTEEQISPIVEEHANTINGLIEARDKYKADSERLEAVEKELNTLKSEDWHKKYEDLNKVYTDYKTEVQAKQTAAKVSSAYTALLKAANVDERRIDAILRVTDLSDKQLDADGKLVDADKLTSKIKEEWGAFIQTTGTKGSSVDTPPKSENTTLTRADIYAKDEHGRYKMSTAERQRALAEHPDLMKG